MELGKFIPILCVLLGLFESSTAVDKDCNFEQKVEPGVTYYVLNPNYPNYYEGQHSCIWRATSNSQIKLNCTSVEIPRTPNCSMDSLTVRLEDDIEYNFCGLKSFVVESVSTEMIIKFRSNYATFGGRFQCELTAIPDSCECGWKNPSRIVGGVETGVNEFPMMAGLVDTSIGLIICGATIVSKRHVITAAHCLVPFNGKYETLSIIVGEHDVTTGNDTPVTQLNFVDEVILHPNSLERKNDIAVLKSHRDFIFSMKVGPACLPFNYLDNTFVGDTVTATGWGTLEYGGEKSNVLMKVELGVISLNKCAQNYTDVTTSQICTFAEHKDACQFDSGGPILYQNPKTNRLFVVGVISYGATCADDLPAVHVRVASHLNFIRRSIPGTRPNHRVAPLSRLVLQADNTAAPAAVVVLLMQASNPWCFTSTTTFEYNLCKAY